MSDNLIVKKEAWNFFLYSYLGIVQGECDQSKKLKCTHRAYLDFCRTIHNYDKNLKQDNSLNKNLKAAFVREMGIFIVKQIDERLQKVFSIEDETAEDIKDKFDQTHHDVCCKIMEHSGKLCYTKNNEEEKPFIEKNLHYGQAQKWLNMTLKYMWMINLLDEWSKDSNMLIKCLHVAVDRYILKTEPVRGNKEFDKSKAWSEWECGKEYKDSTYYVLQETLRNGNLEKDPFMWEHDAWIEIANKENKIIEYDFIDNKTVKIKKNTSKL